MFLTRVIIVVGGTDGVLYVDMLLLLVTGDPIVGVCRLAYAEEGGPRSDAAVSRRCAWPASRGFHTRLLGELTRSWELAGDQTRGENDRPRFAPENLPDHR